MNCCGAYLVLINGVTLLLMLQCRAELSLALINSCNQMMTGKTIRQL